MSAIILIITLGLAAFISYKLITAGKNSNPNPKKTEPKRPTPKNPEL